MGDEQVGDEEEEPEAEMWPEREGVGEEARRAAGAGGGWGSHPPRHRLTIKVDAQRNVL